MNRIRQFFQDSALVREWRLFYYRRALREICPLHEDVPHIVRTIHSLEDF